jgi:Eukaryotic translation initiation factor 3 subunit G
MITKMASLFMFKLRTSILKIVHGDCAGHTVRMSVVRRAKAVVLLVIVAASGDDGESNHSYHKRPQAQTNKQTKSNNSNMSIRCRECGEEHLTVRCPLRNPEDRPKDWQQMVKQFEEEQQAKPFHCSVPMHSCATKRYP